MTVQEDARLLRRKADDCFEHAKNAELSRERDIWLEMAREFAEIATALVA